MKVQAKDEVGKQEKEASNFSFRSSNFFSLVFKIKLDFYMFV